MKNDIVTLEDNFGVFDKTKYTLTYDPAIFFLDLPKEVENVCPQKPAHVC